MNLEKVLKFARAYCASKHASEGGQRIESAMALEQGKIMETLGVHGIEAVVGLLNDLAPACDDFELAEEIDALKSKLLEASFS